MKRQIISILLYIPLHTLAQSSGQNYVMTETMLNAGGSSRISSIQYCDGLGRPNIMATDGLSPNGNTAYTLTEYDFPDKVTETWLPGIEGNSMDWKSPQVIKELSRSTNQDKSPYSTIQRDAIGRDVSVFGPGEKWHTSRRSLYTMRHTNVSRGDAEKIAKRYKPYSIGNTISENGVWEDGALAIEKTSDEDGNSIMVFTDMFGQKILERRLTGSGYNDTYFVYDDYGLLRFVLSPMYQEEEDLEKYAYEYRYDGRCRCIYKRLPGCQPIKYGYDDMDNLIFVQDGELLKKSRCRFMLYDTMGRLVIQGTCGNNPQNYPQGTVVHTSNGICETGYNCVGSISLSSPELEAAYYYDDYDFFYDAVFTKFGRLTEIRKASYDNPIGKQTGSVIKASNGELLYRANYYNWKGQVFDSRQSLLGDKLLFVRTGYSFTGKATRVAYELRQGSRRDSVVVENAYSENNDALLASYISYNGNASRQVANLEYDDLGRLQSNTLPVADGKIEYSYNIRDGVTQIKSRHYTEEVCYDGLYNGNIASLENIYEGDSFTNKYAFTYDRLNRMTKASSSRNEAYMEEANYDQNGNILTLNRWGKHNDGGYKAIDALTYSYNGNQVQHISDQAGSLVYDGSFDFKTSDASGQYRFNGNGSMTYDPDKGITIDYSDTGTPQKISFDSGSSTEYVYSADGTKLKVSWNSGQTMCKSFGGFIFFDDFFPPETGSGSGNGSSQSGSSSTTVKSSTEYAGPFVITDGELKQFLFDGGYCTLDNRQAKFHYYVKDHLGSNRIVMSEDGTIEQKTHYYPFGGVYGDVSTNTDVQDYKYNGKELDHMHGLDLYDYGARMYDAAAGRWTSVDPLAEKYYHISPYAYCANNPVKFVDLHGDSIKIFDIASIEAIYNAVQPGTKLSMKFNNGVLIPESIQDIASESQDVFLQDLYSISIDPQMVEIATTNTNDYFIGDCFYHDNWDAPEDFDYAKEYNNGQESSLFPSGKTLVGNLGQTLFPIYLSEHKRSTNNNIRININSLGNLNQRSCGIAHEFGHVILYLRGLPYTHSGNADFIYERQWNVMKRFGYDYLESTTGKIFRKL